MPKTIHDGPAMRPIGCVIKREDEDRDHADEADDGDDRKLDALAAERHGDVERNLELARAQRIGQAQRDERNEHERVARRRTESVEVAEEIDAALAVEVASRRAPPSWD